MDMKKEILKHLYDEKANAKEIDIYPILKNWDEVKMKNTLQILEDIDKLIKTNGLYRQIGWETAGKKFVFKSLHAIITTEGEIFYRDHYKPKIWRDILLIVIGAIITLLANNWQTLITAAKSLF